MKKLFLMNLVLLCVANAWGAENDGVSRVPNPPIDVTIKKFGGPSEQNRITEQPTSTFGGTGSPGLLGVATGQNQQNVTTAADQQMLLVQDQGNKVEPHTGSYKLIIDHQEIPTSSGVSPCASKKYFLSMMSLAAIEFGLYLKFREALKKWLADDRGSALAWVSEHSDLALVLLIAAELGLGMYGDRRANAEHQSEGENCL